MKCDQCSKSLEYDPIIGGDQSYILDQSGVTGAPLRFCNKGCHDKWYEIGPDSADVPGQ